MNTRTTTKQIQTQGIKIIFLFSVFKASSPTALQYQSNSIRWKLSKVT